MIELLPFKENDFDTFRSWVNNADELFQFAGPVLEYPLTNSQLNNYLKMPERIPLKAVLTKNRQMVGFCELNYTQGKNRLSRIIVGDKRMRGQNIGEHITRKMVDLLFKDKNVNEVDLNVFAWNKPAIACYQKVGFEINQNKIDEMSINGKVWIKLNMVLKRDKYFNK